MSPAILQSIEKPATWFDLQNKLTSFYMCPENTEIPKRRRNISSKWVKLEKKIDLLSHVKFIKVKYYIPNAFDFENIRK